MIERYAFVAITTRDLTAARDFWIGKLGFRILDEQAGKFFMVDAGGLRLCIDREETEMYRVKGVDPTLGFKVRSLHETVRALRMRGVAVGTPVAVPRGAYAELHDPDGHTIVVTEFD